MPRKLLPKSINLIEPLHPPDDMWSNLSAWVMTVGRVILIFVEVLVIGTFVLRFRVDRQNIDLTNSINDNVSILSRSYYRDNERKFTKMQQLLADIRSLQTNQERNSAFIQHTSSLTPENIQQFGYTYSDHMATLTVHAENLADIADFEKQLKNDSQIAKVVVAITRSSEQDGVMATVSFVDKDYLDIINK